MQFQTAGQDLLNQLLECQPNLAFTPMAMKKILFGIAQQNQKAWRFTDQDMEDFSSDVGQTLRLMCRHFAQAMSKNTRPKWVVQIVGGLPSSAMLMRILGSLGGRGKRRRRRRQLCLRSLLLLLLSPFLWVMTRMTRLHGGLLVQLPRDNCLRHSSLLRGPRTRIVCLPVGLMAGSTRSQHI